MFVSGKLRIFKKISSESDEFICFNDDGYDYLMLIPAKFSIRMILKPNEIDKIKISKVLIGKHCESQYLHIGYLVEECFQINGTCPDDDVLLRFCKTIFGDE